MIIVSAVLVVAAFGLLIAGITLPQIVLVYVSIGVSVLAALLLGAGAFKRRGELFGGDTDRSEGVETAAESSQATSAPQPVGAGVSDGGATDSPSAAFHRSATPSETATAVPNDAAVAVVPARGTYHLPNCRQLRTREHHQVAYAEAREQGYSFCSACMPDTVLAARGSTASSAADGANGVDARDEETAQAEAGGTEVDRPGEGGEPEFDGSERRATDRGGSDHGATNRDATDEAVAIGGAEVGTVAPPLDDSEDNDVEGHAGLVGVVSGSHRYHRLTCAVVEDAVNDGVELTTMGRDEAEAAECTRCTVCRP